MFLDQFWGVEFIGQNRIVLSLMVYQINKIKLVIVCLFEEGIVTIFATFFQLIVLC